MISCVGTRLMMFVGQTFAWNRINLLSDYTIPTFSPGKCQNAVLFQLLNSVWSVCGTVELIYKRLIRKLP